MTLRLLKPLEPITENMRNRGRAALHERMGVQPFVFKVRQAGQSNLVRVRMLGETMEEARVKVRQILPKAVDIHLSDD